VKLLAIDTSTEACSAALHLDGVIRSRYEFAPKRHAELILPMVDQLLAEAQFTLSALDAIAFGRGPGAFTGVRIATGIAQGLAFSVDLPLVPVSTLATLAQSVNGQYEHIAAIMDARMGEVYYGLYRSEDVVSLMGTESVISPDRIIAGNCTSCFGVGSGWTNYAEILQNIFGKCLGGYRADLYPHARDMIPLALRAFQNGELQSPEHAAPVYLRNNVTG
jgi:tRNA threonylcarbamoyladenosine biosynthesis protein TsaB